MKTYVGTTLDPDDFRSFAIRAAENGLSKSAYLKKLALEALADAGLSTRTNPNPSPRPRKRKEAASR